MGHSPLPRPKVKGRSMRTVRHFGVDGLLVTRQPFRNSPIAGRVTGGDYTMSQARPCSKFQQEAPVKLGWAGFSRSSRTSPPPWVAGASAHVPSGRNM